MVSLHLSYFFCNYTYKLNTPGYKENTNSWNGKLNFQITLVRKSAVVRIQHKTLMGFFFKRIGISVKCRAKRGK